MPCGDKGDEKQPIDQENLVFKTEQKLSSGNSYSPSLFRHSRPREVAAKRDSVA